MEDPIEEYGKAWRNLMSMFAVWRHGEFLLSIYYLTKSDVVAYAISTCGIPVTLRDDVQ